MDQRLKKKLAKTPGVTLHKGKLRIAFTLPGKTNQIKRTLDIEPTSKNIDFAANKLAEIKMDIMRGTFLWERHFPNDKQIRSRGGIKLKEAIEIYYLSMGSWKASSRHTLDYVVKTMLAALGEDTPLKNIDTRALRKFERQSLEANEYKRVQLKLSILKKVFERAIRDQVLDSTPFIHFEPMKPTADKHKEEAELGDLDVFTMTEADQIIGWHKNKPHEANLLEFLFWSGVRHGEAAALRWSDVLPDMAAVDILRTNTRMRTTQTPKTGKARRVYLTGRASHSLIRQQAITGGGEFVFCGLMDMAPFPTAQLMSYDRWYRRLSDLGLRRLTPYVTRHCFASWALRLGENITDVANALGHVDTTMVQRVYGHFIPKERHKWTLDDPQKIKELNNHSKS